MSDTSIIPNVLVALRLLVATGAVVLLPGLWFLFRFYRGKLALPAAVGLSICLSFAYCEVVTIFSLTAHVSLAASSFIFYGAVILAWIYQFLPMAKKRNLSIECTSPDKASLLICSAISILMYVKGSPFYGVEDQWYIGIVRRLTTVLEPSFTNIHHSPGAFYHYPYSGHLFLQSVIAWLSGLDSLFVYSKLRFLWSFCALLFVYQGTAVAFRRKDIALASLVAIGGFAINGVFADYSNWFWSSALPLSVGSNVGLSVFLPALLIASWHYYESTPENDRFFLVLVVSLIVTLSLAHMKSMVIFFMYTLTFVLGLIAFYRTKKELLKKTFWVLGVSVVVPVLYAAVYKFSSSPMLTVEKLAREHLLVVAKSYKVLEWLNADPFEQCKLCGGVLLMLLLLSPLLVWAFSELPLVGFIGAGLFSFIAITRFPFLKIPYQYFTFSEAMQTPNRNFFPLIFMVPGALVILFHDALGKIRNRWAAFLVALLVSSAVGFLSTEKGQEILFEGRWGWLFLIAITFYIYSYRSRKKVLVPAKKTNLVLMAAIFLPVLAITTLPKQSPFSIYQTYTYVEPFPDKAPLFWNPEELLYPTPCDLTPKDFHYGGWGISVITQIYICPPPAELVRWIRSHLPAERVIAANTSNSYPLTIILDQQTAGPVVNFIRNIPVPGEFFPEYFKLYALRYEKYKTQPFFNTQETMEERGEYLKTFNVTHIILDPHDYSSMKPIIDSWKNLKLIYDSQQWAFYEILR